MDHYSRGVLAVGTFAKKPDCPALCKFLGRAFRQRKPRYIICDRDSIFDCDAFRRWVKGKGIKPPRYGAIGQHGSIAVLERCIKTIKDELTRRITVPLGRREFRSELLLYVEWFNEHRPHTTLQGRTPNEVYFRRRPANRRPRVEPRKRWPRPSRCAQPQTLVAGKPGDTFILQIDFREGRPHLPLVTLKRAA